MNDNLIVHYGVKRRSGRYPWGSGGELLSKIERLAAKGFNETEIAAGLGISTTELRNQKAIAMASSKEAQRLNVIRQKERGMSIAAISREVKIPASTIRDLLKPDANRKYQIIKEISDILRKILRKDKFVDVGDGSEIFMGVSRTKLENAITLLRNEGYPVYYLAQEQLGSRAGRKTTVMVLAAKDVSYKELLANRSNIAIPNFEINDTGATFFEPSAINNVSSKRILVKYKDDGGADKDGLIEVRAGLPEFNLGAKRYAQVRIGVDGTHFMKGMVVQRDDLPKGVDVIYNTSKLSTGKKTDAMKPQIEEGVSRFGAVVKPNTFTKKDGTEEFGVLNIIGEKDKILIEGAWAGWNKNLASQVLSKQAPRIAAKQLDVVYENHKAELDDISKLTNPTVRNHLLEAFADSADRRAVDLKAAALPRQSTNVLLPDPNIKPTEIYAPNYKNGESVTLIRYPHGGVFEIPTLRVNNKTSEFKDIIGTAAKDAVAIHPSVAQKLSGADFDGDFVLVIPNKNKLIRTEPTLAKLKNFEPKVEYKRYPGMKVMDEKQKQRQMGNISNLITDMTIKGANQAEIARAVKHSMVVIDAVKHELNYTQSHIDNGIAALKTKYQGSARSGAATLISKTKSEERVDARKDYYAINPKTGEKVFTKTGETYINKKTGKRITKTMRSTKGYEFDAEKELSSGTAIETVYAKHANRMKGLGNQARLATLSQQPTPYSRTARLTYKTEVASLDKKYKAAKASRPIERKAQLLGGDIYRDTVGANPGMSRPDKRKKMDQSLVLARTRLKAARPIINITPREWQAIELGAVSPTRLKSILRNADMDAVRSHATPRAVKTALSTSKTTRAKSLIAGGYTAAEIASALGVPVSQIRDIDK